MSIPASTIVSVVPSVLAAGGNPLALNGLLLSSNPNLPVGAPVSFPTLASVQSYFSQYSFVGTATCAANTLTVVTQASGSLSVGSPLQSAIGVAPGVPPGSYVTALGTYTAISGVGTVTISGPGFTQATPFALTGNGLESQMAAVYFNGFTASTLKPTALLFSRYPTQGASASSTIFGAAAFLRGASQPALTLAQLQAATAGTITLTINGTAITSASVNLSGASSFANAASLIQAGFTLSGATLGTTVVWSPTFNAFVFQTAVNATILTCAATSITACTGSSNLVTICGLTGPQAITLSQGAAVGVPNTFMAALALQTTNWAGFSTCFEPSAADKLLFATWTGGTGGQFVYAPYDTDITIVSSNISATCISHVAAVNSLSGTCAWYLDPNAAAFCLGFIASTNYNATNGRVAIAFKSGTGITASIVDPTSYANAVANGTNFYGNWATANSQFYMAYNGAITGPFGWLDSYVGAIWLNSALQLALMNMFTLMNSIPYNNAGYATIKAGCKAPLDLALLNGVINRGVALTASQANAVDTAAGLIIDPTLATIGYYLQVLPASPTQRNSRQSPTCTLWYMDGGSVNQLNLASIDIQ